MEISFRTTKLKKIIESESTLKQMYGVPVAKAIMKRVLDLDAAPTLKVLRELPGGCHELAGDRRCQLAIRLPGGKRLVIEPTDSPAPSLPSGGLDWDRVDAVTVVEIVDYH